MQKISIRGFLENLTDNFLNIIVNVNFFGDLAPPSYILSVRSLSRNISLKKIKTFYILLLLFLLEQKWITSGYCYLLPNFIPKSMFISMINYNENENDHEK